MKETSTAFSSMLDGLIEGCQILDPTWRYVYVNETAAKHALRTRDELVGASLLELYPGVESTPMFAMLSRCMNTRAPEEMLNEFEYPDGGKGWFELRVRPVPEGILVMSLDVTAHRAAERDLLQDQFAALAVSAPGVVCSLRRRPDGTTCMPFATPSVAELYGIPSATLARDVDALFERMVADDRRRVEADIALSAASMSLWHGVFRYQHPTRGLRWIEGRSVPRREPSGGHIWHGFMMDITERKAAEAALRETEEQLRAAQKMEAIGRLAGGVAHDFNNLLTIIGSYTDFALDTVRDPDLLADLREVREATRRAEALTRQLLAFSRRQILQPVVVDLNTLVTSTERMLRRLIGEDIDVVVAKGQWLWATRVDPGQIEQVLMNLAVNARDAMPGGGRLTVTTANVELDEGYAARHVDARPGPHVRLTVSDTGCGMDDTTRARIFEPFFTTKGPGKGTGLGLAMVYGIVKQSGGSIEVESAPGLGSTFSIYLPRDTTLVREESRPSVSDRVMGTETILVVEDEEGVRNLAQRILSAAGYRVLVAGSSEEALRHCEDSDLNVALLLTDVVLRGENGRDLAERLAPRWPGMRVLFMSGYTDDTIARCGIVGGETPFIGKPFSVDALTRKVRASLDA